MNKYRVILLDMAGNTREVSIQADFGVDTDDLVEFFTVDEELEEPETVASFERKYVVGWYRIGKTEDTK